MFLKLVRQLEGEDVSDAPNPIFHIFECDHVEWTWTTEDPGEYSLPLPIEGWTDGPLGPKYVEGTDRIPLVVRLYKNGTIPTGVPVETFILLDCSGYIMNDEGQTIDRFAC